MDPQAERAALLPDDAKVFSKAEQEAIVDRRIAKNSAFLKTLEAEGFTPKELAPLIAAQSTAAGNELVEKLAARMRAINPVTGGNIFAPMSEADTRKLAATVPMGSIEEERKVLDAYKRQFSR